ncbi:TPA: hypothetical protein HA251_07165 [Candidatus Woesearchaeota archaeon]|nr:hypothetical protein [Candidatus Woesearchaeota archaeon]
MSHNGNCAFIRHPLTLEDCGGYVALRGTASELIVLHRFYSQHSPLAVCSKAVLLNSSNATISLRRKTASGHLGQHTGTDNDSDQ